MKSLQNSYQRIINRNNIKRQLQKPLNYKEMIRYKRCFDSTDSISQEQDAFLDKMANNTTSLQILQKVKPQYQSYFNSIEFSSSSQGSLDLKNNNMFIARSRQNKKLQPIIRFTQNNEHYLSGSKKGEKQHQNLMMKI